MRPSLVMFSCLLLTALIACTPATATPTPTVPFATPPPIPFEFTQLELEELGSSNVGIRACTKGHDVGTTLRVRVNTDSTGTSDGEWVTPNGRNMELGVPCFNDDNYPIWDTSTWDPGTYRVRVEAKTETDPEWQNAISIEDTYTIQSGVNGHP